MQQQKHAIVQCARELGFDAARVTTVDLPSRTAVGDKLSNAIVPLATPVPPTEFPHGGASLLES